MAELQPFTVVGVYEDNGQPYAGHQDAEDAEHAARLTLEASEERDLIVLCVFAGEHSDMLQPSVSDVGYSIEDVPILRGDVDACQQLRTK
jgi:hypothetical protein